MSVRLLISFVFLLLLLLPELGGAQQPFENNSQLSCSVDADGVLGYNCSTGDRSSCPAYLTFRPNPPSLSSPSAVAALLGADPSVVSAANGDASSIPSTSLILVPVNCSCSGSGGGSYYQHVANFTATSATTFITIANDTFQGLTTCQAMIAQNPSISPTDVVVGDHFVVPLRCACPTAAQAAAGVKYLLTYLIAFGDTTSDIAARFGVDSETLLAANSITDLTTIYPFNTLLIPLNSTPTAGELVNPRPLPPPTQTLAPQSSSGSSGSNTGLYVGIGVGVGVLALAVVGLFGFVLLRRRGRAAFALTADEGELLEDPERPLSSGAVRGVVKSATVYSYEALEKATGGFAADRRVGETSVYRGIINGDAAAVKRVKGDASGEVEILTRINHAGMVRLSGLCAHQGFTFLVFQYAENGALADWLHGGTGAGTLSWKQRVQAAHDVADALNYLHNYAHPPCVHLNLKSSNILLDGEFHAKVANFTLARNAGAADATPRLTVHVVGTRGYLAPEYLEHGLVSAPVDVFALGVVLLELLSGKEAAPEEEEEEDGKGKAQPLLWEAAEGLLAGEDAHGTLTEFMDPELKGDYPFDLAYAVAELALQCTARDPGARPRTSKVLAALAAVVDATADWDPSYGNSTSSVMPR